MVINTTGEMSTIKPKSSSVHSNETTERCSTSTCPAVPNTTVMSSNSRKDQVSRPSETLVDNKNGDNGDFASNVDPKHSQKAAIVVPVGETTTTTTTAMQKDRDRLPIRGETPRSNSAKSIESRSRIPRHPNTTNKRSLSVDARPRPNLTRRVVEQEQALFEQRLCNDPCGVAVRKINHTGKSNLRYVKCTSTRDNSTSSSRSVGSWVRNRSKSTTLKTRVLSWGRKKDVPLSNFTMVQTGKVTERALKNPAPPSRILSLITSDPNHVSLDIEAPTKLDRDKFARAFATFLNVPLETHNKSDAGSVQSANKALSSTSGEKEVISKAASRESRPPVVPPKKAPPQQQQQPSSETRSATHPSSVNQSHHSSSMDNRESATTTFNNKEDSSKHSNSIMQHTADSAMVTSVVHPVDAHPHSDDDHHSHVSSLTGHGYDQELVEDMHVALTELRTQLEESRAEAARAVKVAEQAIQSAEKSNSVEWQNTVTAKAAEAAALAQKRSAAALAKQRLAEERLDGERRAAAFWRTQAELAEEDAGVLQTRAAAAEVQRAAMEEVLDRERRLVSDEITALKLRFVQNDVNQRERLEEALARNRALELELNATRRDLVANAVDNQESGPETSKNPFKRSFARLKKSPLLQKDASDSQGLLSDQLISSSSHEEPAPVSTTATTTLSVDASGEAVPVEQVLKLQAETQLMRQQFELLKRTTQDHLQQLPQDAKVWGDQVSEALQSSKMQVARLQERVAMESASRRKLLHQVQDLRGAVRVYCRPRPGGPKGFVSRPSQETIVLHREKYNEDLAPVTFEFDRVFDPQTMQHDLYTEIQDVCLGVLDGYKICLMAFGPRECGRTLSILGDVKHAPSGGTEFTNHGIQLQTMKQLFTIAEQRRERFRDTLSLTIVEVFNERIRDLVATTSTGEKRGSVVVAKTKSRRKSSKSVDDDSSGKISKLEIRTDIHGDTVVQGLVSVEVTSFDDICNIWKECLDTRSARLREHDMDLPKYEAACHVIATLKVRSENITTGVTTVGRIQFADLAAAELATTESPILSNNNNNKEPEDALFSNRSLETLRKCVEARIHCDRSVPYRNSTLTHLLRDSLEADTKVVVVACVSSEPEHMEESVTTLRFVSRMRKVIVGKATRHTLSRP